MKQTAVEWLAKELESYGDPQICKMTWGDLDSLVNQATQMEEEQIIKAYIKGFCNKDITAVCNEDIRAKQYYYETFKSE